MNFVPRVGLVLSVLVAGCTGEPKREPGQWPLSRGELEHNAARDDPAELTYRRYCIGCHGSDGRGNGGLTGADFTAANGPLTSKPESELVSAVRDGKRGANASMPAHKPVLNDEQIASVVSYVRQRFGNAETQPSAKQ